MYLLRRPSVLGWLLLAAPADQGAYAGSSIVTHEVVPKQRKYHLTWHATVRCSGLILHWIHWPLSDMQGASDWMD